MRCPLSTTGDSGEGRKLRLHLAILGLLLVGLAPARAGEGGDGQERPVNPFAVERPVRLDAVPGELVRSDGTVHRGGILLTREKRLELYCDAEKKWHKLKLKDLAVIKWTVEFEREEREWRWKESGSDVKVYTGRKKIDRRYKTAVTRKDGTKVEGHIRGTVIYVQPKEGQKKRFFIYWNHPSDFDQKPEDLVYVEEVRFGEEHAREPEGQKLTPEKAKALQPVIDNLASELKKISGKYPEMKAFDAEKAKSRRENALALGYKHELKSSAKWPPKAGDFGGNGFFLRFSIWASVDTKFTDWDGNWKGGFPSCWTEHLNNFGLHLTADVFASGNPSPGVLRAVKSLVQAHVDKVKALDKAAGKEAR